MSRNLGTCRPMLSGIVLLTIALGLVGIYYLHSNRRSKLPLPPGPRKKFLVGNLFDIPPTLPWEKYMKWSRLYESDIIHLNAAGQSMVILSSMESAVELLEKRSSIYSNRPRLTMANELMGWDFHLAFMSYGESWRAHRRLFHNAFQADAAKNFHPKELASARTLLRHILDDPEGNIMARFQQMTAENIMHAAYGIDILPADDPYVQLAEAGTRSLTRAVVPGAFLVDAIPVLKFVPAWFPGAGFHRKAKEWKILAQNMQDLPFDETKRRLSEGRASHSFVADALNDLDDNTQDREYQESLIKATAGSMYSAGADTTLSALGTFVLAMLEHPEVQRKAQSEIDLVLGNSGRLPDFGDEAALLYVSALVKEVLRWRPVAPLGFPHLSTEEDEYRGYRIPKGSIVISNLWAMFYDETIYPDPYKFKPERYLEGDLNPGPASSHPAFGFGRRICPARHMAASTLFITFASILAVFDITKPIAEDGSIIEPTHEYTAGAINITPLPFKCCIKPRSKEAAALVQAIDDEVAV
ncbi:cytochrome P450 [Roridomyces roridus]|uniref:Cytochrome P450 n=1 Tax=Roridomyces roridus TaxID=1738132 RepID=A0AAD7B1Y7_9AGAR|nr:cytochrome P450 [Roridomyces roridus]